MRILVTLTAKRSYIVKTVNTQRADGLNVATPTHDFVQPLRANILSMWMASYNTFMYDNNKTKSTP